MITLFFMILLICILIALIPYIGLAVLLIWLGKKLYKSYNDKKYNSNNKKWYEY